MSRHDSNYLPVRPDWLARRHEPALEPDLPIIDAHHHLWERPGWRYLLARAAVRHHRKRAPPSPRPYSCNARRCTACGARRHCVRVGETEFVNGIAAAAASGTYGPVLACAGIVGHADLRLGAAVGPVLDAHIQAGGGRFRGIRHITVWDADASLMNPRSAGPPGMLADAAFRDGFAQLHPRGLSFDAWLFHPQMVELTELARAFPDTTIVLDHLGGVLGIGGYAGQRDAVFQAVVVGRSAPWPLVRMSS